MTYSECIPYMLHYATTVMHARSFYNRTYIESIFLASLARLPNKMRIRSPAFSLYVCGEGNLRLNHRNACALHISPEVSVVSWLEQSRSAVHSILPNLPAF